MNSFLINLFATLLLLFLMTPTNFVFADITVRPFLIDETYQPRDSEVKTITLTSNNPNRKTIIYATVNEITVGDTGEIKEFVTPVMTDRTNTVTSWVEITRGRIELMSGEKLEVPLTLKIHPYAQPGIYHVFVGFAEASKGPQAEAIALAGKADGVIVKITIADDREDSMKISSFLIDRFITNENKRGIDIEIENLGDLPSAPKGEIVFYDSRGVEVTSSPVNKDGVIIAPGEKVTLKSAVPLDDSLGRFKANITLNYGDKMQASLFDTTFFYMMPMHLLLMLFGGILVLSMIVAFLLRRAFSREIMDEDGDEVVMYIKEGHDANPKDHDIDLKNKT